MTRRKPPAVDVAPLLTVLGDLGRWSHQCHAASVKLVQSRVLGETARVARGRCPGVGGQHSWVVLGDPYDETVTVIDPTLWSYDATVTGIWTGRASDRPHVPHGAGLIWDYGKPTHRGGETIELTPTKPLSAAARRFLQSVEPLDAGGWLVLASHCPVGGWPAGEILAAMDDTPRLTALVPIDLLGMLTDRNPGGLYLPVELIECPACGGTGETVQCVNDGTHGCSHTNDIERPCRVCDADGSLTAKQLAEAAERHRNEAAEHDVEPESWAVAIGRTPRVSERATVGDSRSGRSRSTRT